MNDLLECANCFSSCKECVLTPRKMKRPDNLSQKWMLNKYTDQVEAENKGLRELGIELKHSIYAYLSDSDLKELNEKADKLLNNK